MFVILDVDHTLLDSNISFLFGKELYRKKYISFFQAAIASLLYGVHRCKMLSQTGLHRVLFRLIFKGREREPFQDAFRQFFSTQKERLVRSTLLATIRASSPTAVVLFSSSPDFIVKEIGKVLGIDEAYGTEYVIREGKFSSLGVVLTGENKAVLANKLMKGPFTVYTDSSDDIPLLEIAAMPIAVSPDRTLFRYAQKKGWTIILCSQTS